MKHVLSCFVTSFLVICLVCLNVPTTLLADEGSPSITEAEAWILTDNNGNVLSAQNEYAELPPESITKVMTAMVLLDSNIDFSASVTIPKLPASWENAQVAGLKPGTSATVRDLFQMMLVYSANDAAYALATAVSGSEEEFSVLMNQKAKTLQMDHTHFVCASGMETENHYSCAADLCRMGRYADLHYPLINATVMLPSCTVTVNGELITLYTTDHLLHDYAYARGIKTGAGKNVFTFLGAAEKNGTHLFNCVLGCKTENGRFVDTQALFDWGFDSYLTTLPLGTEGDKLPSHPFAYQFGFSVIPVFSETETYSLNEHVSPLSKKICAVPSLRLLPKNYYPDLCSWYINDANVEAQSLKTTEQVVKHQHHDFLKPLFIE